jgi:S1-C subfamily serine protease
MFASSFLAGPRFIASLAVLILFLSVVSPVRSNGLANGRANTPAGAIWRLSGKLANDGQEKDHSQGKGLTAEARATVRNAVPAVGQVMVKINGDRKLFYRGSAVVVRSDGIIVTNHHVIYDKESNTIFEDIYLQLSGDKENAASNALYRLELISLDRLRDLALLRVIEVDGKKSDGMDLNLASLELGDERKLELLDDVVVIGFPEKGGPSATLSVGVVEGIDLNSGWIKTDARLLHGNSGGAAVNREGKLIGIATKVVADETENNVRLGMIGYLRSVSLVRQMIGKLPDAGRDRERVLSKAQTSETPAKRAPAPAEREAPVRGVVKDERTGDPIAGARVGLLVAGSDLDVSNLITWGGTNAEGVFVLEKPVLPGIYTLRVRVVGDFSYAPYNREVEIKPGDQLVIKLSLAREQ